MVAGHDTTASLIGNGVVALLDHPGQLEALLAGPGRLPAAIDELVRFTAPVPHATFRVTAEPVTLGGVRIPAHEQVLVCLGSANRDPGRFPGPQILDIARTASRDDLEALIAQSQKRSAVFDIVTNPTQVLVELV